MPRTSPARRNRAGLLRRVGLTGLGLAVGVTALAGCGASSEDTIQVYSARHYDLEEAFAAFTEETGIEVEFLFGEDAELRERISAEGEDTDADAYLTVDAGNLAAAAEQGIFRPVESEALADAVPPRFTDPQDRWFGLAKRMRTIVYAPDRVDPDELSTYEALTEPQWDGRLCLRTAQASYTQSLVASMIAERGEERTREIVEGWVENGDIYSNDVEIIENLASGACDVAIINHYYLARELRDDPDLPVEVFWADQQGDGVHVNISGGGVTADADNPEDATRLLEWLATEGQDDFIDGNLEYPINPAIEVEPILQEFGTPEEQRVDAEAYATLNSEAVELLAAADYE